MHTRVQSALPERTVRRGKLRADPRGAGGSMRGGASGPGGGAREAVGTYLARGTLSRSAYASYKYSLQQTTDTASVSRHREIIAQAAADHRRGLTRPTSAGAKPH